MTPDERRQRVRQNRVVLAPVAGVKSAEVFVSPTGHGKAFNPPMTVTRRIRRRGERGISRKAIAQGRRNAPTVPVCSCAFPLCTLHTRPRVQQAPGVPCALFFRGETICKARAKRAAGSCSHFIRS